MRARRQISDLAVVDVKLRAVAISQRGSRDGFNRASVVDLTHAAELLAQNLHLAGNLKLVRCVLVVTASAAREKGAGRRDPVGGPPRDLDQLRVNIIPHLDAG